METPDNQRSFFFFPQEAERPLWFEQVGKLFLLAKRPSEGLFEAFQIGRQEGAEPLDDESSFDCW